MIRKSVPISLIFFVIAFFCNINELFAQLNASFTIDTSQGCAPLIVRFNNTSTGSPDSCSWDFGNGNRSKICGPVSATYTSFGNYTVRLTIFKAGQQSSFTRQIRVFRDPIVNFDASVKGGCVPLSTVFTNSAVATDAPLSTFTWDFGDGRVSSQANPAHTYLGEGGFGVTLIVTDANGCKTSLRKDSIVVATDRPTADFVIDKRSACSIPFTANFKDSSFTRYPVTYEWDFGNGATSNLKDPSYTYNSTGNFNVKLKITNRFGCSDDTTKSQEIKIENVKATIQASVVKGCAPLKVNFKGSINVPLKSFFWDFGNGITSTDSMPSVTYADGGTFTVKLIGISQQNCSDTITQIIQVGTTPIADFSTPDTAGCALPFNVQLTNLSSANAINFSWNFGDGGGSTLKDPLKIYNREGSFFVRLIATSAEGCADTTIKLNYIIIQQPVILIVADPKDGCAPLQTNFSLLKSGPGTIQNVAWTFGNGNTFNGLNPPRQTFNSTGNFNNSAQITFAEGCPSQILNLNTNVGLKPSFAGTLQPNKVCAKTQSVSYRATGGDANTVFTWYFGDGGSMQGRNVSYEYSDVGTFSVSLVGSNNGCKDSIFIENVQVLPPVANYRFIVNCFSKEVSFINNSNGADSSYWEFGDGTFLNNPNPLQTVRHTFPQNGSYNVKLTVYNKTTQCKDTLTQTVDLKLRRPFFIIEPQIGCSPLTISLKDTNTFNRLTNWDMGDTIIQSKDFQYTYYNSGLYNINIYTLDINGCRDTFRFPTIINAIKYDAGFSMTPPGGCAPINVQFADTTKLPYSTIVNWNWDFGGLGAANTKNPVFNFAATDTFDIRLITKDNFGCVDTVTNQLITAFPKADFTSDFFSVCTDVNFQFKNLSRGFGLKYFWDFGNGKTSTDSNPSVIYNTEGDFTVKLVIEDANGCRDSISKSNFVSVENYTYDFDASPRFKTCPELLTNFIVSPSNITYREVFWDFGNGNQSRDTSRFPSNIYNTAGKYTVSVELIDFRGCKEKIVKPDFIEVRGPSGSFTIEPDKACAPAEITFKATVSGSQLNFWDFGDGTGLADNQLLTELKHSYATPGDVKTSLVLDDRQGCIVNIPGPSLKISDINAEAYVSDPVICTDEILVFTDTSVVQSFSPAVDWFWDFGDGNTGTGNPVQHFYSPSENREYIIKYTVTDSFGCKDTDSLFVEAFKNPPLQVSDDVTICKGNDAQLNATGVKYYQWSPIETISNPNIPNPIARPLVTTDYIVMGYDTLKCPGYDTVRVNVLERVSADAGPDTSICIGSAVQLFASVSDISGSKISYEWKPELFLNNPDIANPVATPQFDITYLVTIKADNCLDAIIPVSVNVGQYPDVTTGDDKTIFKGEVVPIESYASSGLNYQWSPNYNLDCVNCPIAQASPDTTTLYYIRVTNVDGCSDIDSVLVRVFELCDGSEVFVPNTFTPNGDGVNDILLPQGDGISQINLWRIYNRWGELIFESEDINRGWDGLHNGVQVQPDVFVYYIEAICINGQKAFKKGNVTLLR